MYVSFKWLCLYFFSQPPLPPCSVNFGSLKVFESPWVVYAEMVSTSAVYLRDSTMVWRGEMVWGAGTEIIYNRRILIYNVMAFLSARCIVLGRKRCDCSTHLSDVSPGTVCIISCMTAD